jgi:hypothetical protein
VRRFFDRHRSAAVRLGLDALELADPIAQHTDERILKMIMFFERCNACVSRIVIDEGLSAHGSKYTMPLVGRSKRRGKFNCFYGVERARWKLGRLLAKFERGGGRGKVSTGLKHLFERIRMTAPFTGLCQHLARASFGVRSAARRPVRSRISGGAQ